MNFRLLFISFTVAFCDVLRLIFVPFYGRFLLHFAVGFSAFSRFLVVFQVSSTSVAVVTQTRIVLIRYGELQYQIKSQLGIGAIKKISHIEEKNAYRGNKKKYRIWRSKIHIGAIKIISRMDKKNADISIILSLQIGCDTCICFLYDKSPRIFFISYIKALLPLKAFETKYACIFFLYH